MKRLFIGLILLISVFSTSFAQEVKQESSVLNSVVEITSNVVDSIKPSVVNTVAVADTSSNFKMIYNDVSEGVQAIAQSLKVGAEHVYKVLVKQQAVNSITWLIIYLFFIIVILIIFRLAKKSGEWDEDSEFLLFTIIGGIITVIFIIVFFCSIEATTTGLVNPEYGAMKDVVEMVQKVKNPVHNH